MKTGLKIVGVLILLVILSLIFKTCSAATGVFSKVVNSDNIIESYEEYEEMYSTCNKICDDLRVLNLTNDKTYSSDTGFSKGERIIALENKINRWVREYNAKSRMFRKNMWKSRELPYQLSRNDFMCK